jgi:hypothetical protein
VTEAVGNVEAAADPTGRETEAPPRPEPAQVLVRQVNEEISRISAEFDTIAGETGELDLVCECTREGCFERLGVLLAEYEQVRSFPARFIVKPGHESGDGKERVVSENERFLVIEKSGPWADDAIRTDPRREAAEEPPGGTQ